MRPLLGDFLAAASEHIDAATCDGLRSPTEAAGSLVRELARLTAVMSQCADAFVVDDYSDSVYLLDAQALAVLDARSALRHAAARMHTAACAVGNGAGGEPHPAGARLAAATAHLSASHDLLQSHFAAEETGSRWGNSLWAPAIVSTPVNAALVTELGRDAGRLSPSLLQLAATFSVKTLPASARVALTAAGQWLRTAEAASYAVSHGPGTATGQGLLRAIPANIPPPRRSPRGDELVPDLCAGAAGTAERLRHLAYLVAIRPSSSRMGLAVGWQRTAQGASIISHCGELILRQLTQPVAQSLPPAVSRALQQANNQIRAATAAWRAAAHEWDTFTTGPGTTITSVAAEIGDLVLWAGRLAYTDPAWTPARGQTCPARTSTAMTSDRDTIIRLAGALHQTSDTLAHIAANDRESVRLAAADRELYVPRRLLPEDFDLPYRYVPAPPAMIDALLAIYDATTQAAIRAVAALDNLALTLNPQPTAFAALRSITPLTTPYAPDRPAIPSGPPTRPPQPGQMEQALRRRGVDEPTLLARAADIDEATQDLINATTAPSQRGAAANRAALDANKGRSTRRPHPAHLAAKDVPPYTNSNTPLPRLVPISHPIRHRTATRHRQTP